MTGGRTYLTQVTAPESRPPSERPRASLYSGPWARWPVGTPRVVQVVSSFSPGARATLHPPRPPAGALTSWCLAASRIQRMLSTYWSFTAGVTAGRGGGVTGTLPHGGGAHSRCKAAGLRHASAPTAGPRAESGCPHPQLPTSPFDFRRWQCQQSSESGPDPQQISKEHLLSARHQSQDYCGLRRKQVQLRLGWGGRGDQRPLLGDDTQSKS